MKKTPAVLLCSERMAGLKIAGLTVIDRLVIAAHRAGCAPIIVVAASAPPLLQAEALKIFSRTVSTAPEFDEPVLMVRSGALVEARDLERVIGARGRLVAKNGNALPVEINTPEPAIVIAEGLALPVGDDVSARVAERQLWASLTSTADGLVDRYFNRPVGRFLSKLLVGTLVSPNQVSIASIVIGLISAGLFADAQFLAGAIALQISAIVDCVDGDLARVRLQQSSLGKWLDLGGDQVVHFSAFAAIGIGLTRIGSNMPAFALGLSAAVGVIISFIVILRAMQRSGDARNGRLQKLIDATTNRDFSVLLLILASIGRMDLFLWMAGIGVHLFWITALYLQHGRGADAGSPFSRRSA